MKKTFYPILCALLVCGAVAIAAPGDKNKLATPDVAAPGAAFSRTFHLGENQLRVLVPGAFTSGEAIAEDPFAGGGGGEPARPQLKEKFNLQAAAASARDVLISKLGLPIRSDDDVELSFRDSGRLVVSAPPRIMNLIGVALDDLLVPPQARLKLHVFQLDKPQSVADLLGEEKETGAIDAKDLAVLKKKILAAGGKVEAIPEVVTTNGRRAKIEMIREFIYPTEYDPPEIPSRAGAEKGAEIPLLATPSNPTAFDVRNVGLTWEVEPMLRTDGSVLISGLVEDVQFLGHLNYGSPINGVADVGGKGKEAVMLTENKILMPVFSVTKIPTEMTLAAGGGMIALTGFNPLDAEPIDALLDKQPQPGQEKIKPAGKIYRLFVIEAKILRND